MTSTVNEVTRLAITSSSYGELSSTVGLTAILLLVVLLVQKEALRASTWSWSRRGLAVLDIAIMPLLMAFSVITVMRFIIEILHR